MRVYATYYTVGMDAGDFVGVFTTPENAQAACQQQCDESLAWTMSGHFTGRTVWESDYSEAWHYYIEECVLDEPVEGSGL